MSVEGRWKFWDVVVGRDWRARTHSRGTASPDAFESSCNQLTFPLTPTQVLESSIAAAAAAVSPSVHHVGQLKCKRAHTRLHPGPGLNHHRLRTLEELRCTRPAGERFLGHLHPHH
jgi:hypothetical protein